MIFHCCSLMTGAHLQEFHGISPALTGIWCFMGYEWGFSGIQNHYETTFNLSCGCETLCSFLAPNVRDNMDSQRFPPNQWIVNLWEVRKNHPFRVEDLYAIASKCAEAVDLSDLKRKYKSTSNRTITTMSKLDAKLPRTKSYIVLVGTSYHQPID